MYTVSLLFTRPVGGFTSHTLDAAMLVQFGFTEELEASEIIDRFKAAVTQWSKSEAGRLAYEDTSGGFNVGDLFSEYDSEPLLAACLAEKGLLEVKCLWSVSEGEEFPYDTNLITEPPDV